MYAQNYAYAAQKPSTEFFKIKMRLYSENEAGYSYVKVSEQEKFKINQIQTTSARLHCKAEANTFPKSLSVNEEV